MGTICIQRFEWLCKTFVWAFVFIMTGLSSLERMRALPELLSCILLIVYMLTAFFVWSFEVLRYPGARKIS